MELPKDPKLLSYDAYAADGRALKETVERDLISAKLILSDMAPAAIPQRSYNSFDIFNNSSYNDEGGPLW